MNSEEFKNFLYGEDENKPEKVEITLTSAQKKELLKRLKRTNGLLAFTIFASLFLLPIPITFLLPISFYEKIETTCVFILIFFSLYLLRALTGQQLKAFKRNANPVCEVYRKVTISKEPFNTYIFTNIELPASNANPINSIPITVEEFDELNGNHTLLVVRDLYTAIPYKWIENVFDEI